MTITPVLSTIFIVSNSFGSFRTIFSSECTDPRMPDTLAAKCEVTMMCFQLLRLTDGVVLQVVKMNGGY